MIANQKIDREIFTTEQKVSQKQADFKNAQFTQWKAQKGFL